MYISLRCNEDKNNKVYLRTKEFVSNIIISLPKKNELMKFNVKTAANPIFMSHTYLKNNKNGN